MKNMKRLLTLAIAVMLLLCPMTVKATTEDMVQSNEEIREVLPVLDVVKYREFYPDLDKAFGDNWKSYIRHYFTFGIEEGRENFTDFDANTYLSMYPDLQLAFGDDLVLATKHYLNFGIEEGRAYSLSESKEHEDYTIYVLAYLNESFTGEETIDFGDGTYMIKTYVNGVLTAEEFYDANGNCIKESYYEDGKLMVTTVSKFNSKNQRIQYEVHGTMVDHVVRVLCDYDESGDLIEQKEYHIYADHEDYTSKTVTDYYENRFLKSETRYNSNDIKMFYREFHETGGLKQDIYYYADGNTARQVITYDTDGNISSVTTYDESGTKIE